MLDKEGEFAFDAKNISRRFLSVITATAALSSWGVAYADEEIAEEIETPNVDSTASSVGGRDVDVDVEDRKVDFFASSVDRDLDAAITLEVNSSTDVTSFNNRDLRELDETSTRSIEDSDDRSTFGYSDVLVDFQGRTEDGAVFDVGFGYGLPWKDDQLRRKTGGSVFLTEASAGYERDFGAVDVALKLGRQPFSIGGLRHDYILSGTADAVTAGLGFGKGGGIRVLAFEIFSANDTPESGYAYYKPGVEPVFGLRGETNTYRAGVVYENENDGLEGLMAKAYYFYASVGGGPAGTTGADMSAGGVVPFSNVRDRDYQHLFGARLAYQWEHKSGFWLKPQFEFARSMGIDRKEVVAVDVDTNGNAFGAGLALGFKAGKFSVEGSSEWYRFDGAEYSANGLQLSHGFVGFRGGRAGGLALGDLSSWRPSATLEVSGVDHSPHDYDRAAGTDFTTAALRVAYDRTALSFGFWIYTDTAKTNLNVAQVDQLDPPLGYSREEFRAQARAGKRLGHEIEVQLEQGIGQYFSLFGTFGMFTPGEYYAVEVERIAAQDEYHAALGGEEKFWAMQFGGNVHFGIQKVREQ